MTSRQKRALQGSSSSQPTKKAFLAVQKEVSSPLAETGTLLDVRKQRPSRNPTSGSKGDRKDHILKPNMVLTNRGDKSSSHSSNGMFLMWFEPC